MIPKDELPDDPAEWDDFEVTFPRLEPDTGESCPFPRDQLLQYLDMESGDAGEVAPERLKFIRTAKVEDDEAWIWSYTEADGELTYVTYWAYADGSSFIGTSSAMAAPDAARPLSPEQYLLAEYHELIYW